MINSMSSSAPAQQRESKYARLLKDKAVERWYRNMERGSALTAEVSLRRLGKACELMDSVTPKEMIVKARKRKKQFQNQLEDLISRMEQDGKAPQYINGIMKVIKSWLNYNDITLTRKIKITNASFTPTIEDEQVPSQEELARVFRNSTSRVRLAEALLAFSDLRPETLGSHKGTDGLELRDLPEVRIVADKKQVEFDKIPTRINVRASLSKTRQKYFTFLGSEGCAYLKEDLEARMRRGEVLRPDSAIIEYERLSVKVKPHLPTSKITALIRKAMRKAGVYKRPYVLRAYAETQLIIAESKGKISHPYLQFIAGHKGDIEARYSTNKGSLPPDMIEGMRNAYKDCEPFLSTLADISQQSTVVKEAKIEALKSVAKSMFGIDLLDVKIAKENRESKQLSQDDTIQLFELEIKKLRQNPDPQTIVEERDLPLYLKEGWQFVSVLPSQKVVVRK